MFAYSDSAGRNFLGNNTVAGVFRQKLQALYDRFARRPKLLTSADAVGELEKGIKAYVTRVQAALGSSNAEQRKAELERLYALLVERRRQMEAHPVLQNLDETGGRPLFPLPVPD